MEDRFDIEQVIRILGLNIRADQADGGADFDVACNIARKKLWKVKEYEDLEEQGKLLKIPCAVGNTVYQCMIVGVDKDKRKAIYEVFEAKVFKFSLDSYTLYFWTETVDEKKYQNEVPLSAFGKTVFLTREEAENALKEL